MHKSADGRFRLLPPPKPDGVADEAAAPRARYRVLHTRVAIRAGPSTSNAIVGVAREGREVESLERRGNWIRMAPRGASALEGLDAWSAWIMLDGAEVGLGPLLQLCRGAHADPEGLGTEGEAE